MRLLIVVPVFNEKKYVGSVLDKILTFWPDVLVVDDGSTDGTADVLRRRTDVRILSQSHNMGYGQSLIDGFAYADRMGFDWVITMDCDEQHEPEMIPTFIREIREDQFDLISGSRYLHPRTDDDLPPSDRRAVNQTITTTLNDLFGFSLTDAFCGFKAHRVSAMRRLRLDEPGYAFPLQLWPQVTAARFRIKEIPVRLIYNDPNRHFGGSLDDVSIRLQHYLDVLKREMRRLEEQPLATEEPAVVESCCCCSK